MKRWVGTKRNFSGHAFNTKVAERLRDLGWNAEHDLELPGILNIKLDKAYGDVDVFAWHKTSNRVLAIECKDLQFAKTEGEIAKQLYEFRGKDNHKRKPDRLKKHLQRISVLDEHAERVGKFTDMEQAPSIEIVLVFSSVVPMAFSEDEIFSNITVCDFDSLECSIVNNA